MVGRKAGPRGHGSMNKKQQQKKMQKKDSGGRSNGKKVGPQLASSLLKELKGDGDRRRKQSKEEEEDDSILPGDVYEYEEQLPEEEAGKNRRYDSVDQLDYELPSDFEDEEIDEDIAFGEDNEDVETTIKRKTSSVLPRTKEVNLNSDEDVSEEEDEDDEDDEDEDIDGEEDERDHYRARVQSKAVTGHRPKTTTIFAESDEEGEEEKDDDDEEEEDAEKKHQNMLQAVTRKASEARQEKASKRKEVMLSESYQESEFNLNPGGKGSVTTVQGISVEELMGSLHETAGFGALRKRMQQLEKRGAPVHPPLPKAMQEKVERKVGYEKTRDEITKWQPQVKMNREARTLFFNQKEEVVPSSTAALAAKFTPTTDMEKEIASVLSESKLGDVKAVEAAEALELNKLTVEEVRERQQRLAKMRSLLFQHEAKAKRVRNIKSKTFHRLQKDHKHRAEDTDAEAVKDAALKQEVKRAEERMTLKHKNTSRWAKRILKRGLKEHEDGSWEAIAEQLRTHSMLTRKIQSVKMSSSSEESSSEEEGDEGDEGLAVGGKTRARLLAKAKMATVLALQGDGEAEIPTTGLFALPFMTRAIERKRKESQDEALAVLEQLEEAEQGDAVFDKNINVGRAEDDKAWGTSHSGRLGFGDMSTPAMNPNRREKSRDEEDSMDEFDSDANLSDDEEDKIDGLGAWQRFNRMEKSTSNPLPEKEMSVAEVQSVVIGEEDQQVEEVALSRGQKSGTGGYVSVGETVGNGQIRQSDLSLQQDGILSTSGKVIVGNNPWLFGEAQAPFQEEMPGLPKRGKKRNKKAGKAITETLQSSKAEKQIGAANVKESQISSNVTVAMAGVPTKVDNKNITNAAPAASSGKKKLNGKKSKMVAPLNPAEINAQIPTLLASAEEEGEDGANDQGMKLLDKTMSQEELIRRAFAGDDVEAEFVETKARALDEEVPRVEGPVSLPGWGQWTHIQQKKGQPAWILKEQESLKNKRDAALSRRKDAKLQFVMISEKMDKKASKFCASKVPFPYRSREVFERTIEMPIGRDYNTDKSTRDMTRPSEIKKAGVVIEPLKLNMSIVKNAKLDVLSHVVKRRRERDSGNKASSNQLGKKIRT